MATVAVGAAAVAGAAWAQAKTFDVPAQPAATGVAAFARQADVQVLVSAADAQGRGTNAVRGSYPVAQGLSLLLDRTGLKAQSTGTGTWTVVRVPPGEPTAGGSAANEAKVSELVVTGSLIRGAPPAGAHLLVLTNKDLAQTGRGNLQDVMQSLPQNFGGAVNEAGPLTGQAGANGGVFNFGSSLNLRGLGADATLTLLNGRRLAPSGYGDFVDVSVIPMAAVSRVEVLADGASATYGSDALAGVVNVIFDKTFEGADTQLRYGVADGLDERRFSQLFGKGWSGGHAMVGFEYYHRGELKDSDRAYTASADLRPFGGRDFRLLFSVPGNIVSPAIWAGAIPAGQNGLTLQPSDILKGQSNLYDTHAYSWLMPRQSRYSVFGSVSQAAGDRVELYADLLASRRDTLYLNAGASRLLSVPSTNYYRHVNGFGGTGPITIDYNLSKDLGALPVNGTSDVVSADGGARVQLFGTWAIDAYAAGGSARDYSVQPNQDLFRAGNALAVALASSDPATAFNPFGDGGDNPPAVLASLLAPLYTSVRSRYASANIKVDGDLFSLPAGPVKLAAGGEFRAEDFHYGFHIDYRTGLPSSGLTKGDRHVGALFGEVHVPLVGEANAIPGIERLDLSISGRYDRYSDFGSTTNPKIGLTYEPARGLQLHGAYGTSFKAPRLNDLNTPMGVQFLPASKTFGGPDPNGDGFTELLIVSGGNPKLTAEKGKAWTAGIRFAPEGLPGFTADLTYFRLGFTDRIAQLPSILSPLQNPGPYLGSVYFLNPTQAQVDAYVNRASSVTNSFPVGLNAPIEAIVITQVANVSVVKLDGVDLHVNQAFETDLGSFMASANFTYYLNYKSQFSPTSPAVSVVGVAGAPIDVKGRFGLAWSRAGWSAAAFANYQGSYTNDTITPAQKIKSQTTLDLSAEYRFGDEAPSWARGVNVSLSAANLFNQAPPFVDLGGYGFDSHNYSPVGRLVSLTVDKRW